jgi:hypothetical protein
VNLCQNNFFEFKVLKSCKITHKQVMNVLTIRQIDRNLSSPDWVEFMWIAAHAADTFDGEVGEPGLTPSKDLG